MTEPQDDPIVGHKTFRDGDSFRHEPLRQSEADAIMARLEAAQAKRIADMPTEQDAARAMCSAWQRLKELGWRETCYGPTGVTVQLIEPGSSGIHLGSRHKEWPEKTWWIEDGDLWPSNPCLYKLLPATPQPEPEDSARTDRSAGTNQPEPPAVEACRTEQECTQPDACSVTGGCERVEDAEGWRNAGVAPTTPSIPRYHWDANIDMMVGPAPDGKWVRWADVQVALGGQQ